MLNNRIIKLYDLNIKIYKIIANSYKSFFNNIKEVITLNKALRILFIKSKESKLLTMIY